MLTLAPPMPVTEAIAPEPEPEPLVPTAEPELVCYLNGRFLPLSQARVGILTHAFLYGTAVFEGIRGY